MAIRVTRVCDFPEASGEPATVTFTGRAGGKEYGGDFCDQHWAEVEAGLAKLGVTAETVRIDGKKRATYVAASGRPFSTNDVRQWLLERGGQPEGSGRLPRALLEEYAAAH